MDKERNKESRLEDDWDIVEVFLVVLLMLGCYIVGINEKGMEGEEVVGRISDNWVGLVLSSDKFWVWFWECMVEVERRKFFNRKRLKNWEVEVLSGFF